LDEASLVLQGKAGLRRRTDHKITAEGRRYLRSAWKELIEAGPSGDLDADLRAALLALFVGDDRDLAPDFLRRSAAKGLNPPSRQENRTSRSPFLLSLFGTKASARPQRMLF
jgi:hypothetical protein